MFNQLSPISNSYYEITNLQTNIPYSSVNNQQDYGLSINSNTISCDVNADILSLFWSVIDPLTNLEADVFDGKFDFISIELLDQNNELVSIISEKQKDKFLTLNCSIIPFLSKNMYGDENFLRSCKIKLSSYTVDGKIYEAYCILNFPIPSFSSVSVSNLGSLFVNYNLNNRKFIKSLGIEKSPHPSFSYIEDYVEFFPAFSLSYQPSVDENKYYRLKCTDYYNTGIPYNLGQVKISSINNLQYNLQPQNITGAILAEYDSVANNYNRQLFVKWAKNITDSPIDYEIHLYKKDLPGFHNVYYYNTPKIDQIDSVIFGTGTGSMLYRQTGLNPYYSGLNYNSVFSPSGNSGISWQNHSLRMDSKGSFSAATINISGGSLTGNKCYFNFSYNQSTQSFSPSGYSSGLSNGSLSGSSTGISYLSNYTGILVAERFDFSYPSGSSTVVLSSEPYFFIPIESSADYQVKIRGVISDSVYTAYSNIVNFSSQAIDSATRSVFVEEDIETNKLIDGIYQSGHNFTIGDVVRYDEPSSSWKKAIANSAENAEVAGMVQFSGTNYFKIVYEGKITGLSGLTGGNVYFLSPTISGGYTHIEPTASGQVSKPVLLATSSTGGKFLSYRGFIIG